MPFPPQGSGSTLDAEDVWTYAARTLTNLSDARAAYIDLLNTMEADVWRHLEQYTPDVLEAVDNDANYVTVCNITGRGILVSYGIVCTDPMGANGSVQITKDGGAAINHDYGDTNGILVFAVPCLIGFASSMKVEMKISGVGTAKYFVTVLTE